MARHLIQCASLMLFALFFLAALNATAKHLPQAFTLSLSIWARYSFHCLLRVVLLAPPMRLKRPV